jgi:transposase, IS6 family
MAIEFKGLHYPKAVVLHAVFFYVRYAVSYRDLEKILAERGIAERGIAVDAATIYRWVQKFGPEIAKRTYSLRSWRGLDWHVDETYVRVGGKWCYLWRAVDQRGQLIDFRLTAKRDAKAARAFLRQAQDNARLYQPLVIFTDKAATYAKVIKEINRRRGPGDEIIHIDKKWKNNRIESDYAALKRIINPGKGFHSLRTAKATLQGVEAMRTIKRGDVHGMAPGVPGEVSFVNRLFGLAA